MSALAANAAILAAKTQPPLARSVARLLESSCKNTRFDGTKNGNIEAETFLISQFPPGDPGIVV